MQDGITPSEFEAADGAADWRVVGDGAQAVYRTASLAESARFVDAIAAIPGVEEHPPIVDIRHDGVTLRLITVEGDWYGMTRRDVEMAGRNFQGGAGPGVDGGRGRHPAAPDRPGIDGPPGRHALLARTAWL